ncbi:DUF4062 domain-containing protein [Microbacterium terregens]|uniref:DUF4062 domain-containing protein n=1 Tax=Microbacterium terregens TaxID=69363 RepID=A0ABV5T5S6_9MICO
MFVSSTLAELAEERAAVARAIESLGLSPVMFELGARPHPPQELYRAYLAQSDIFIGLYWESYGWIGPNMDISGLEDEFRLSGPRPRLLYLKAPAPARQPRLSAMIDEIREQGTDAYRTFHTAKELRRLVRSDLALLLSERFVSGAGARAGRPLSEPETHSDRTLPITSTSLIGREDDIEAVLALLDAPDVRMVTLSGAGGLGKTRIAIAVGEAIDARNEMRVVFAPLAATAEASAVIPRVASAAGASIEGMRSARDALIDRIADERTLLILDNLEQVAAVGPELHDLLAHCPGLKILTTSRTVLRIRAEHEYAVGPLAVPAPAEQLTRDEALALPAVQLFVDRAVAVRRGFVLTAENSGAVLQICRRLDGVPLAIELAAARIRLLEPDALLSRLEHVLDAFGAGPVDLPERQRTLRATVEWSVGLLDEAQRGLLATLSVFADGWTIAAAAEVCSEDEDRTLDLLDALAGHSLVSVDAAGAEPRFRMLSTVREFAGELLRGPARDEVELRHAECFSRLVESEGPPEELVEWTDRLAADEENIRVAIRWLFAHDVTRLPHLLRTLWLFWQMHDRMSEGRDWARELYGRVDLRALDLRAAAELTFITSVTAVEVGDDDGALGTIEPLQRLIGEVDDPGLRSLLWLAVSWALPITGDVTGALNAANAAYEGFAGNRDPFVAAAALTVGMVRMSLGDDESARPYLLEVDQLGSRFDLQWLTSSARTHLAVIDVQAGDHDAARRQLRRVMADLDTGRTATLTACQILYAFGRLSAAEAVPAAAVTAIGAMDGLRARAGRVPWPNSRRGEADLRARMSEQVDPEEWDAAYAAGHEMRMKDALGLVRHDVEDAPTS